MSDHERTAADKADFKRELTEVVPHLRAFARGLCGRADMADDLVQETLLKAWAAQERFQPGTSMRAWTFVILRNAYLTDMRRNRFRGEYDETVAERVLTVGRARAALNAMLADGNIPKRSISDSAAHRAILQELDDVASGIGSSRS